MPLFFFDYSDGGDWRDDEGVELPDVMAAEAEARRTLPRIMEEAVASETRPRRFEITVSDERGEPIYSASMSFTGMRLPRTTGQDC